MSSSEQTPLLSDHRRSSYWSLYSNVAETLTAEGQPSWHDSYRWFIFRSWLNVLLLFLPVAGAAHYLSWDAPLRFGFCFISIISLAKVCDSMAAPRISEPTRTRIYSQLSGDAIEQISLFAGPTVAGLLNASFGNVIEIIVGITALLRDEFQIVQTAVCALPYLSSNSCSSHADARLCLIQRCLCIGVFLLCWYVWPTDTLRTRTKHARHHTLAGGIYQKENLFHATVAQTSALDFGLS